MTTATEDRDESRLAPVNVMRGGEMISMPHCKRCKLVYLTTKSTSELRLTYCSFLCELGDLGFSISGLEHMERAVKPVVDVAPEAPLATA